MGKKVATKNFFAGLIICIAFLVFPNKVFAQVVINEFSSNSDPEWVELYNNSDSPVDITGWSLKDEANPSKPLTGSITARGYFVFESPSGWLNNSGGDTITLFNNASPLEQVDQVVYGKSDSVVGTPDSDKSAGRTPDGSSTWQNQLIWTKLAANPSPTPTPTNSPAPTDIPPTETPAPTDTPAPTSAPVTYSNISISEFMANQSSGDEWVELYNDNDFEVNLSDWFIDDISGGGEVPRSISGTISAKGYKQFFVGSLFLNNDGDDVRLLDNSQSEKDKKSYSSSTKDKSWSKDSGGNWCQTNPTPNSSNPTCPSLTAVSAVTLTPSPTPTFYAQANPEDQPNTTSTSEQLGNEKPKILGQSTVNDSQLSAADILSGSSSSIKNPLSPEIPKKLASKLKSADFLPFWIIFIGIGLIGTSLFLFWKLKKKKENVV